MAPTPLPEASDKYRILPRKVGEGAYGEVFEAIEKATGESVVIKTIRPDKANPVKLRSEIEMLKLLADGPNIVQLLDTVQDSKTGVQMLVFELVDAQYYKAAYAVMNYNDMLVYMYKTLLALAYTHDRGVIHRDIKGGNILFDVEAHKLRLIDWGFATFHSPRTVHHDFPGTRYYKAPELFLRLKSYDYACDMWSLGCVLGMILFQRNHFLKAKHNTDEAQMIAIARALGTDDYATWLKAAKPPMAAYFPVSALKAAKCPAERQSLCDLFGSEDHNGHLVRDDAVDLLEGLLRWDPADRLTASQALASPIFAPLRARDNLDTSTTNTTNTSRSDSNSSIISPQSVVPMPIDSLGSSSSYSSSDSVSSTISAGDVSFNRDAMETDSNSYASFTSSS
ncbi:CMGC/CK2 protein kinase [Thecamonas trahens ATCC 50062]|uniref:non-specific serine/threonine protein kinase n=1 Tax=Thecamonas trahens ATCC 50062 TaxID=461836 RepID=A0A0L0DJG8_THETB|nr:CMGC/CK2 protein kinase [Thecamonas trahens ATCC 50062]KNC52350.1 CMGC/CK2 protein kinase [Thecamonas trahens ATCC 50062]|eukprot:XP_013755400.1 CMGC/CK2 protein kinase [Thecamonas trahens ATCC 50062]